VLRILYIVGCILLLGTSVPVCAEAKGFQLDFKLHQFAGYMDMTQRLTKDLGGVKLMMGARQFKLNGETSNHLNLALSGKAWGVEYLSGENVTNEMRAFSLFAPGGVKAQAFNTPCESVLHSYVHQEFTGGFVQFDHYDKDGLAEWKLNARAEF